MPKILYELINEFFEQVNAGNLDAVKNIYEKCNIIVGLHDNQGLTALHIAAKNCDYKLVEWLLSKKARVDVEDCSGKLPIHYTTNKDVINLLKESSQENQNNKLETPLHIAVQKRDIAELLIQRGVNINAKDEPEYTTLHIAVKNGDLDIVKLFLHRGEDINLQNVCKETALHLAIINGHKNITTFLLERGADVNAKNKQGITPLHIAIRKEHDKITRLLLERDVDVNVQNESGDTPLICINLNLI